MVDSIFGAGNIFDEPGISCARVKRHTETNGITSKGHRRQSEGPLTGLGWDIWESKRIMTSVHQIHQKHHNLQFANDTKSQKKPKTKSTILSDDQRM